MELMRLIDKHDCEVNGGTDTMKDADSNINIQMNYWFAEMTNMDVITPLFDYIEVRRMNHVYRYNFRSLSLQKTWAPRGAETRRILYNITRGFVTHDEVRSPLYLVMLPTQLFR